MISFSRFSNLSRRPGIWLLFISVMLLQFLFNALFAFEADVLTLLWTLGLMLLLLAGGTALISYFTNKPVLRRRMGLALAVPLLLYLQLWLQPPDQYGVRPITEVRGAVSAALSYEALSQRLLNQKPAAPHARRTALIHKYRDELPQHAWLIGFEADRTPAVSASITEAEASFGRFYVFNMRNDHAATNYPAMINAKLIPEEKHLQIDIAHASGEARYEVPLQYEATQPVILEGSSLSGSHTSPRAAVYIQFVHPEQHSRFQYYYYRLLNLMFKQG